MLLLTGQNNILCEYQAACRDETVDAYTNLYIDFTCHSDFNTGALLSHDVLHHDGVDPCVFTFGRGDH